MSEKGESMLPQPKCQKKLVDDDLSLHSTRCFLYFALAIKPNAKKSTYNASDSTYILWDCLIKMGHNMGSVCRLGIHF